MNQSEKAKLFIDLHIKGNPIILYNVWDVGSARAVFEAGAKAIATSSWAIAEAQGYQDGEAIPFGMMKDIVGGITANIDVPVTMDFEGGYSDTDDDLAKNVAEIMDRGVVGINFEDRVIRGSGLYDVDYQSRRIKIIRSEAQKKNIPLFINARTDVFFGPKGDPENLANEVIERAKAYADAGASGLFVPGLEDATLIERIVEAVSLPLNVLISDDLPSFDRLSELGVARMSYGALPYIMARNAIKRDAEKAHN